MKIIAIPNGLLHVSESLAACPQCSRSVAIEQVDGKLHNSKNGFIRHKCKGCQRFMGITSNYKGDIVSYKLEGKKI